MDQERVFKALADESRRTLLDQLFQQDGQSLGELTAYLPQMTRYGVMKHLQILEDAGLITTRKVGREKHHYINPVPIQEVYDRWVSKYAQPFAQNLTFLKMALEEQSMSEKPSLVFQIFIRTSQETLWNAITDGKITQQYYFGSTVQSTWEQGADYAYVAPDGSPLIEGEVLEADPMSKLVTSFRAMWVENPDAAPASRVTYDIEPAGSVCKLTVTHTDIVDAPVAEGFRNGWSQILSSLKTLLETGEPLQIESGM